MKILSIDYGTKKLGLAISDDQAKIALPYKIIPNSGMFFLISEIKKICRQEDISQIIVGLPKRTDTGKWETKDKFRQELQKFINKLKSKFKIPIKTFDERLSSKIAVQLISGQADNSAPKDAVAAMIILKDYLKVNMTF